MVLLYQGLIIAATVFIVMLFFFSLRKLGEMGRRKLAVADEAPLLVPKRRDKPEDWSAEDVDQRFNKLVHDTDVEMEPQQVVGLMALMTVLICGGLYLWREQLPLVSLGILLGIVVPLVVLWMLRGRYRNKLQQQLPDMLYLIARSLRAGTSLEQSIQIVGNNGAKPMADEFKQCSASVELGMPIVEALSMMAQRIDLIDFNAFVSAVAFHKKTGGNLPLILDRLAASARDHNQFRGQVWAATAQGRLTSIALALAAPALVLGYLIFQPDFAQNFIYDPRGWLFLAGVALLETIGIIWVWRILKIEY